MLRLRILALQVGSNSNSYHALTMGVQRKVQFSGLAARRRKNTAVKIQGEAKFRWRKIRTVMASTPPSNLASNHHLEICMDPEKRYRSGNTCLSGQQRKAQLARCENAAPKPHPHCPPAMSRSDAAIRQGSTARACTVTINKSLSSAVPTHDMSTKCRDTWRKQIC